MRALYITRLKKMDGLSFGIFALVALIVLWPLLTPGYLLILDMVFTPHLRMPTAITNAYALQVLLHSLNEVLTSDVIEKLLLFTILWLSGEGMYRLVRKLNVWRADAYQKLGWYVGSLLYVINPFTYDRFMVGQYEVLLGYACLPWFTVAFLQLLDRPSWRTSLILAAWATTTSIVSIHATGFMMLIAAVGLGLKVWQQRAHRACLAKLLRFGIGTVLCFVIASSYWLIPLMIGKGTTASTINSFTATDQSAFVTLGGSVIGRLGNVLQLQGFWAEGQGLYNLPQDSSPLWCLLSGFIWLLVIVGVISFWRSRARFMVSLFGLSAGIATFLAIGTYNTWLASHIPFFAGYREPEKFVTIVALAYGIYIAQGTSVICHFFRRHGGTILAIFAASLLCLIPFLWTPTMIWGFDNQLIPVAYPANWSTVNTKLDTDHSQFQVLFLPWHLYMYFNFAGRIIANPAPEFFDKPVIISNDPQFNGIAGTPNTTDTSVDHILAHASQGNRLGAQLATLNVKYIILARDDDYMSYGYLNHQKDLRLVRKTATLELYRNEAFGGQ